MHTMVEPFLPRAEGALKPLELAELLRQRAVTAVDTRDAAAYARAHVPGAVHMPLEELESRLAELYMMAERPVLYCRSGDKTKELAARLADDALADVSACSVTHVSDDRVNGSTGICRR